MRRVVEFRVDQRAAPSRPVVSQLRQRVLPQLAGRSGDPRLLRRAPGPECDGRSRVQEAAGKMVILSRFVALFVSLILGGHFTIAVPIHAGASAEPQGDN